MTATIEIIILLTMKTCFSILCFLFFILGHQFAKADPPNFWVASSAPKETQQLSKEQIKDIFLGKKTLWEDGRRIIICHLKSRDKSLTHFLNTVLGMSPRQYDFYWKSKVFSGQGYPPRTFNSHEEIINYLKLEPRAIGILNQNPMQLLNVIYSADELKVQKSGGLAAW